MTLLSDLNSKYELTECLGSGAAGTVFRARHRTLGRVVALKQLRLGTDPEMARRFDEEARTLARLSHPRIPKIYDYGWDAEMPYIAMELIAGDSLRAQMIERGVYPVNAAFEVALALLEALEYVHGQGLRHRDVKPENVLCDAGGALYLADFGLAYSTYAERTRLTEEGALVGTLRYMAPELFEGGDFSESCDLYAVAVILFELVTGRPPFHEANVPAMISAKIHDECLRARQMNSSVPEALEELLASALARDPAGRPRNAHELGEELKRCARSGSRKSAAVKSAARPGAPALEGASALEGAAAAGKLSRYALAAAGVLGLAIALVNARRPESVTGPPPVAAPSVAPSARGPASPAPPAHAFVALHERPGMRLNQRGEWRAYWLELNGWLEGRRDAPPHLAPALRLPFSALEADVTWSSLGDGRTLRDLRMGVLLDWIARVPDSACGWFTLARGLQMEEQRAIAERVMRHGLTLLRGGKDSAPSRWPAGPVEALISALLLDGPFDPVRWRELEARLPLGDHGPGALSTILGPREPVLCEQLLIEYASNARFAAAVALHNHLIEFSGDRQRARALWAQLLLERPEEPNVREAVFLDRIARGDFEAAQQSIPDDTAATALHAVVTRATLPAFPVDNGEMGRRARIAYIARLQEAGEIDALAKLEPRVTERRLRDPRERDVRTRALVVLAAARGGSYVDALEKELRSGPLDQVSWREIAGPWDDGSGPVPLICRRVLASAGAATPPPPNERERGTSWDRAATTDLDEGRRAASRCALALALAEARRGRHTEAHALLEQSVALHGPRDVPVELELEVLTLPYLTASPEHPWTPPAWAATYVPESRRGGHYALRVRQFLASLRAGDRAAADAIAVQQIDEVGGLPVWGEVHLLTLAANDDAPALSAWVERLRRVSRYYGAYAWPHTALKR